MPVLAQHLKPRYSPNGCRRMPDHSCKTRTARIRIWTRHIAATAFCRRWTGGGTPHGERPVYTQSQGRGRLSSGGRMPDMCTKQWPSPARESIMGGRGPLGRAGRAFRSPSARPLTEPAESAPIMRDTASLLGVLDGAYAFPVALATPLGCFSSACPLTEPAESAPIKRDTASLWTKQGF
jgi:hypothetical protein